MLPGGPVKTAMVEALRLLREQDLGDVDDLADRIHSRLQLPVLAAIPQASMCWSGIVGVIKLPRLWMSSCLQRFIQAALLQARSPAQLPVLPRSSLCWLPVIFHFPGRHDLPFHAAACPARQQQFMCTRQGGTAGTLCAAAQSAASLRIGPGTSLQQLICAPGGGIARCGLASEMAMCMQDPGNNLDYVPGKLKGRKHGSPGKAGEPMAAGESSEQSLVHGSLADEAA